MLTYFKPIKFKVVLVRGDEKATTEGRDDHLYKKQFIIFVWSSTLKARINTSRCKKKATRNDGAPQWIQQTNLQQWLVALFPASKLLHDLSLMPVEHSEAVNSVTWLSMCNSTAYWFSEAHAAPDCWNKERWKCSDHVNRKSRLGVAATHSKRASTG